MNRKAVLCSKMYDAVARSVLNNTVILVQNETIQNVLLAEQLEANQLSDYEIIDLRGLFVTPGLIDTHVHLGLSGQTNPGSTRPRETIGDWTLTGLKNAQQDLMAGFTSMRVCGDRSFISEAIRNSINRGDHIGPRLMTCGQYIGSTGGHADDSYSPYLSDAGLEPFIADGVDAVMQAARYNIKHGCNFIKFMASGGVMSPGTTVGMQQMTFEEMRAACHIAKMYGMTSATHAHGTSAIKDAVRAGVTSVEHGTMLDDEGVTLMAERGTVLVPTLVAIDRIVSNGSAAGMPEWAVEKAKAVKEHHIYSVQKCMTAGIPIAFGTDTGTPFSFHGSQFREFELLKDCGMSSEQALACATITAASLMGWETQVGSLEPSKFADIVAFSGDPINDISALKNCVFVMKNGIVYKTNAQYIR